MNSIGLIAPYKHEGMWVFDDPLVGLSREPFVAGIDTMIDRLVAAIPNAESGFRLPLFARLHRPTDDGALSSFALEFALPSFVSQGTSIAAAHAVATALGALETAA